MSDKVIDVNDQIEENINSKMIDKWKKDLEVSEEQLSFEEEKLEKHIEFLALEKEFDSIVLNGFRRIEPEWEYEKNERYHELLRINTENKNREKYSSGEAWQKRQRETVIPNIKKNIEALKSQIMEAEKSE